MGSRKPRICTALLKFMASPELEELLQGCADGRSLSRARVVRSGLAYVCQQIESDPSLWLRHVESAERDLLPPAIAEAVERREQRIQRPNLVNVSSTVELNALIVRVARGLLHIEPADFSRKALAYACGLLEREPTPRAIRFGLPQHFADAEQSVMPLARAVAERKREQQHEKARKKSAARRRERRAQRRKGGHRSYARPDLRLTPVKAKLKERAAAAAARHAKAERSPTGNTNTEQSELSRSGNT
jgi:hypothetical protein